MYKYNNSQITYVTIFDFLTNKKKDVIGLFIEK